jgi:hypothetical protein
LKLSKVRTILEIVEMESLSHVLPERFLGPQIGQQDPNLGPDVLPS